MIGMNSPAADTAILDNLLTDAIVATYQRCRTREDRPVPTFNDLRQELETWRDESEVERIRDEAQLAAVKLREWTGEKVYARLFDKPTTVQTDENWLFFNVEGLTSDPKLESAMSMIIANAMSERASGRSGQANITVLDECWSLLDSAVLAPQVEQLFRTGRKRGASIWGISQALEDFVGTEAQPRPHGPGIVKNVSTKIIGQQQGDLKPLASYLHLNQTALNEVRGFSAPRKGRKAQALLVLGEKAETTQTINIVPTPIEYWICTTFKRERMYRSWFLETNRDLPLLQKYEKLAAKFPLGLADVPELPEEMSGAVKASRDCGSEVKFAMESCKKLIASCFVGRGRSTIAVLLALLIVFGLIAPPPAVAQIGAIAVAAAAAAVVSLIVNTIGGLLGTANGLLGSINGFVQALANLWQNVVYPINLINRALAMVNQLIAQFRGLVAAIDNVSVRSATLPNPTSLEVIMRNRSVADLRNSIRLSGRRTSLCPRHPTSIPATASEWI